MPNLGTIINGQRGGSSDAGDASVFEGSFTTVGAAVEIVPIATLPVNGALSVIRAARLTCVRVDAGGPGQFVGEWVMIHASVVRNALDGSISVPNPLQFASSYTAPGTFAAPPNFATLIGVDAGLNRHQIEAVGVVGYTLNWTYSLNRYAYEGAILA